MSASMDSFFAASGQDVGLPLERKASLSVTVTLTRIHRQAMPLPDTSVTASADSSTVTVVSEMVTVVFRARRTE